MPFIVGTFFTTTPDKDPCPYEVLFDTDKEGAMARRLLREAGIATDNSVLMGHFTMKLVQPDDWEVIGKIEGLKLNPWENAGSDQ